MLVNGTPAPLRNQFPGSRNCTEVTSERTRCTARSVTPARSRDSEAHGTALP